MKKILFLIAVALFASLLFLSATTQAEVTAGTYAVSPNIGAYVFDGDQNIRNAPVYGIRFGHSYTDRIGIESAFGFVYTDSEPSDKNVRAYTYQLDGLYHMIPQSRLVPFLAAGIGAITIDDDNGTDTNGMFNYGAGIKYDISESLLLRGDVRHIIDFEDSNNNFAYTFGLTYLLGKKEKAPAPEADSDGDGVSDDRDNCPDTPPGVPVDSSGCPLDSDGDGVYDYLDRCPDTPAGVPVDSSGCPIDSDGDGVADYMDKCPDTPEGVAVDSAGCPIDSDGDGVPDGRDRCPDTPLGIEVDEYGCPLPIKESVSITLNVQFDFDSAVVKEQYDDHINNVAKFLKEYPDTEAVIEGHTCNIGTEEYNMKLSRRRAESVMQHLIDDGVSPARLKAVGYGESMPIADNSTREGRRRNRRVTAEISTIVIKLQ